MPTKAELLRSAINKAIGCEAVKLASDPVFKVEYIPTGVLPIDLLFHGGLPRGRFVLIEGDYSTLKSYVGYKAIAETQRRGETAALIDTEHAFDPTWAEELGIDVDKLIIWPNRDDPERVESAEMAIDVAESLVRGGVDLIVFDSIAAALPQAERNNRLHGENGQPARLAAVMSKGCKKLTAANSKTAILWINQLRINLGVSFGPQEIGPGGKAMGFYASMKLTIKKVGKITEDSTAWDGDKNVNVKQQVGQKFKATIDKSKLNRPFREVWFSWSMTDKAIDETGFLIAQGLEHGFVIRHGKAGWRVAGSQKQVSGKDKFKAYLNSDPAARQRLKEKVWTSYFPGGSEPPKKRVLRSSVASSRRGAPARTPAAGRAASSRTAARRRT